MISMNQSILFLSSLALFLGVLIAIDIGRRIGVRRLEKESERSQAGAGLLDGSIFGLLGLLLAFTFNGAMSRFDHRKELVMQEANAIGTAYLRLNLLPSEAQPELRNLFRQYLDARLDIYHRVPDMEAVETALAHANVLQGQTWVAAVKACQASGSVPATTLLLPAMNEMFDIATLSIATGRYMHPPLVIFIMLFGLALSTSVLAGFVMAGRRGSRWIHVLTFAAMTAGTVYVILDIEYPRFGLIRVDIVDQIMVDVRKSMD